MFQADNFTKKYVLALSLIALLSILAYINLNHIISKQSNDGEVINISGKQRMLSQQIALFALEFKTEKLNEDIYNMEIAHKFLMSLPMNEDLKKLYFKKPTELDQRVKRYIYHGKEYYKNSNEVSLKYIVNNSQILLSHLDTAVLIYQVESEQKVLRLKDIELYILLVTLITLMSIGFFIFKPANTNIKNKTQEILDEKRYSDTITESNTNAIIVVGSDFKVKTYNKSAQEIFGFTKEEMIGYDSLLKIIPVLYQKAHLMGLNQFFRVGRFKFDNKVLELTALRKNGQAFPIRISFGTNDNEKDKIVVANIQDISDEVNKDVKILQQSRYAAMGEMIGNIAHQWRQPLSTISTISSGAKIRKKANIINDDELDEVFDKITEQTKYLSETIDSFRNFFKKSRNKTNFKIIDVIKQATSLTDAMYKDNQISVVINDTEPQDVKSRGSEGELSQVFMNILNNSKDALIEKDIKNRLVYIKISKMKNEIVIDFHDNALGINNDIINKVFEPYFTTKHKSQGTGIGLFMSKEIVEKHFYGSITVINKEFLIENEKYLGACFTLKIPSVLSSKEMTS